MCMVKISELQNYLWLNHVWTHARTDVHKMADKSIKQTMLCLLFMGYWDAEFIAVNDNQLRRPSVLQEEKKINKLCKSLPVKISFHLNK